MLSNSHKLITLRLFYYWQNATEMVKSGLYIQFQCHMHTDSISMKDVSCKDHIQLKEKLAEYRNAVVQVPHAAVQVCFLTLQQLCRSEKKKNKKQMKTERSANL